MEAGGEGHHPAAGEGHYPAGGGGETSVASAPAGHDRAAYDLLVVVVTFRSAATLPDCLASLAAESDGMRVQLVVVENGRDAMMPRLVGRLWPGATVILNERNVGFASAVNQGLAFLGAGVGSDGGEDETGAGQDDGAPAVLLLNPDARLGPGSLRALLEALDRHPEAGIVAPRLDDARGRAVLSCYPDLSLATVAWRHFQLVRLFPNAVLGRYRAAALAPDRTEPLAVDWAQGACLLVRQAVVGQIGGLDPRFFFYGEEVDLCRRARRAGWHVLFVPPARVGHAEGSSSAQVVPFKLASHYYCKVVYFARHRGRPQTTLLRGLLLADLGLRMAYRRIGVVLGRPKDARQRLAAYRAIARRLLHDSADEIAEAWRAEGERL